MRLCKGCQLRYPEPGKMTCEQCLDRSRNQTATAKRLGNCTRCKKVPAETGKRHCSDCLNRFKEANAAVKLECLNDYGGAVCSCCGEKNTKFLTLDHIHGGGRKHRSDTGYGSAFYVWLKNNFYPPGLRVYCYNCNCGSFRNGGVCPHKELS